MSVPYHYSSKTYIYIYRSPWDARERSRLASFGNDRKSVEPGRFDREIISQSVPGPRLIRAAGRPQRSPLTEKHRSGQSGSERELTRTGNKETSTSHRRDVCVLIPPVKPSFIYWLSLQDIATDFVTLHAPSPISIRDIFFPSFFSLPFSRYFLPLRTICAERAVIVHW